ncbi:MAG: hypothetical protein ABSG91_07535 [Syntrophobacteraceae bacterium]|jgi:hypothetical protein
MKPEPATQPDDFVSLCRRAFKEFGSRALWNVRELEDPNPKDALVIARYLRVEGNLAARRLAERIERVCAMPLTNFQSRILRLLAAHRNPESYVAGSTPLNRDWPRVSEDIDILHDREERVAQAAEEDAALLQAEGLDVVWMRREPATYTAEVRAGNERTRLE